MDTTSDYLHIAGLVLGGAGLILLVTSLALAWRRGEPIRGTFWAPREMFNTRELAYNRVGFLLSVAGIMLLLLAVFRVSG